MTAAQIPAEGAAIVYRTQVQPTNNKESAPMTDTTIPTTTNLLAAFLRLACEFRTDYRARTAVLASIADDVHRIAEGGKN